MTHDARGNHPQAGHDPQLAGGRTSRLAQAGHWLTAILSRTLRRRTGSAAQQSEAAGVDPAIIERRALMLHNRNRTAAQVYIDTHAILSRGRA